MLPSRVHEYLGGLHFDPNARRQCCPIPLGGIYWSDEIPDFQELLRVPDDERQSIYRLFGIRFRLWANEVLSPDDDIFWCYCEKAYPECPILRRTALSPEDQKAQDECVAETIEGFNALFAEADKVEVKNGLHGTKSFSATFDLKKERLPAPFWRRILRRWTR